MAPGSHGILKNSSPGSLVDGVLNENKENQFDGYVASLIISFVTTKVFSIATTNPIWAFFRFISCFIFCLFSVGGDSGIARRQTHCFDSTHRFNWLRFPTTHHHYLLPRFRVHPPSALMIREMRKTL